MVDTSNTTSLHDLVSADENCVETFFKLWFWNLRALSMPHMKVDPVDKGQATPQ